MVVIKQQGNRLCEQRIAETILINSAVTWYYDYRHEDAILINTAITWHYDYRHGNTILINSAITCYYDYRHGDAIIINFDDSLFCEQRITVEQSEEVSRPGSSVSDRQRQIVCRFYCQST